MSWKYVQYENGKYRTTDSGGGGASSLADLTDTSIISPTDGQVLKYNGITQKWQNANEGGGGGVTDYNDLFDRPQINGKTLTGNKLGTQLGLVDAVEGKGLSSNDYTDDDKGKVDKIDVLSTSVSGNLLSFTTKSAQLANNTEIVLEPIQAGSGDPSPTNWRDISGYNKVELSGCGKNLFNHFEVGGIDTSTGQDADNSNLRRVGYSLVVPNKSYHLSGFNNGSSLRIFYYGLNKNYLSTDVFVADSNGEYTITIPENVYYIRFHFTYSAPTSHIQLEYGTAATEFENHINSIDISLSLPKTVYGGKLNVRSGELVVDRGIVDLGSLTWNYDSEVSDANLWATCPADCIDPVSSGDTNAICPIYKRGNYYSTSWGNYYFAVSDKSYSNYPKIIVYDTRYSNAATFQADVAGIKLVYTLKEPYTIQLTPHEISLLLGDNVITTNGTTISLDYNANGEIASLADVSSVAESVNSLSEICKAIPEAPTANGTYALKVTVSNGTKTYSWV